MPSIWTLSMPQYGELYNLMNELVRNYCVGCEGEEDTDACADCSSTRLLQLLEEGVYMPAKEKSVESKPVPTEILV